MWMSELQVYKHQVIQKRTDLKTKWNNQNVEEWNLGVKNTSLLIQNYFTTQNTSIMLFLCPVEQCVNYG